MELRFLNIDNIHKVRGALTKLNSIVMNGKLSDDSLTNWYKTVEDTKWFVTPRTLLALHKCSNAQMLKCSEAQKMLKCQMLKCTNAQKCSNAVRQTLKCQSAQTLKRSNAQIQKALLLNRSNAKHSNNAQMPNAKCSNAQTLKRSNARPSNAQPLKRSNAKRSNTRNIAPLPMLQ